MLIRQFVTLALFALVASAAQSADSKPNVLFIAIDDLRPDTHSYGDPIAITPNIDRLAARSLQFENAYTQYPLCNPSRSSLLTGLRPETLGIFDLQTNIRDSKPDVVSLPQLFKNNGYQALSFGKIYHTGTGNRNDFESWSAAPYNGNDYTTAPKEGEKKKQQLSREEIRKQKNERRAKLEAFGAPDVPDEELADGRIAREAAKALRGIGDKPFFLAVGFHKPHLPFVAPKKYWDLYDPTQIQLAENQQIPAGAPEFASNHGSELRGYQNVNDEGPITDDLQRQLKHGYLASTSFTDAQIGVVLDELDKQGLTSNTIVVLWGDHGYQLGEHGTWTKQTVWELSARVPLLLSAPGINAAGKKTRALAELVDVYPTLAELASLPAPASLEGTSLAPLLSNPDQPWKQAAFTTIRRNVKEKGPVFGRSIRTDRYRLVEWKAEKDDFTEYELYDHSTDADENTNVAGKPENAETVKKLTEQLHAGWKGAVPRS